MIHFFRKIRKKLANENKFQKYTRYAIGEVALIMIGIFMALQLNNWNENRKQEIAFKTTLELLYNSITQDVEFIEGGLEGLEHLLDRIDTLIYHPNAIKYDELPYFLNQLPRITVETELRSETFYHSQNLNYHSSNQYQNNISKEIIKYANNLKIDISQNLNPLEEAFLKMNLYFPNIDRENPFLGWIKSDSTYYNKTDLDKYWKEIKTNEFRSILKNLRATVISVRQLVYNNKSNGVSLLKLIKSYYPEAKILFMDVGIIGTSLNGYDKEGGTNTPLIETDVDKNLWEIDLYLKEGSVKFRCRDSWAQNWGGESFPKGEAQFNGPNIPVNEEGNYHIILDLSKNTYEFIKLEE